MWFSGSYSALCGCTVHPKLESCLEHSPVRGKAEQILKELQTTQSYVSPGELPILYAALGEREQAFASLEKAYAAHDLQLQYLGVDPSFDSLRADPRFQDLLGRVGLLRNSKQ